MDAPGVNINIYIAEAATITYIQGTHITFVFHLDASRALFEHGPRTRYVSLLLRFCGAFALDHSCLDWCVTTRRIRCISLSMPCVGENAWHIILIENHGGAGLRQRQSRHASKCKTN